MARLPRFTRKNWQNGPAGGTKINDVSLKDLEQRLGDFVDDSFMALPRSLAKDPFPRLRVRNDYFNPRPANTSGWALVASAGTTLTASSVVADTDFNEPNKSTGGQAFRGAGTVNSSIQGIGVLAGDPLLTNGALNPAVGGYAQPIFARCRAKLVSGVAGPNNTVAMYVISAPSGGTPQRTKIIKLVEGVSPGDILDLEGFDAGAASSARAAVQVLSYPTAYSAATAMELRVGLMQIVWDPTTECPRYVSGNTDDGYWEGSADGSPSYGYLPKSKSSYGDDFVIGTNNFAATYNRANGGALADDEYPKLLEDVGGNMDRIPMPFTGMASEPYIYWPSNVQIPDFTADTFRYKDLLENYRARGKKVCWLIGGIPAWMANHDPVTVGYAGDWDINPTYRSRQMDAINALISTYPDVITAVEYHNEPNFSAVWGSYPTATPDPALYMVGLSALYTAIKAVNPQVTVLCGPAGDFWTTTGNDISARTWIEGLYANGLKTSCDALAVHIYVSEMGTNDVGTMEAGGWPTGFHPGFDMSYRAIRRIQRNNNDLARPLWLTETGANIGYGGIWTERAQAQWAMLSLGMMKRDPVFKSWMNNGWVTNYDAPANDGWSFTEKKTMRKRLGYNAVKTGKLLENDWTPVTLLNGWTPVIAALKPRYRYLPDGSIQLTGAVAGPANTGVVILLMPPGREPGPDLYFQGMAYNGTVLSPVLWRYLQGTGLYAMLGQQTTQMYFDLIYTPVA